MDEVCGLRKKEEVVVPADLHQGTAEVASWNRKKVWLSVVQLVESVIVLHLVSSGLQGRGCG